MGAIEICSVFALIILIIDAPRELVKCVSNVNMKSRLALESASSIFYDTRIIDRNDEKFQAFHTDEKSIVVSLKIFSCSMHRVDYYLTVEFYVNVMVRAYPK